MANIQNNSAIQQPDTWANVIQALELITDFDAGFSNVTYESIGKFYGWPAEKVKYAHVQLKKSRPKDENLNPEQYRVNLADNIADPEPDFKVHGTILCSPGNLLTIKGKQKNGKTFGVTIFIAANFFGKYLAVEGTRKKIAWIETEQSINQLHKIYRRAHRMAGFTPFEDNPDLRVYYASELDVPQRWELFETLARDPEIGIIIIDVSTDLINDINDQVETKAAADKMSTIAKENNILIIATIHENKKDSNATGFFGGSLQKKSEAVISLTKADGIFTISATDTRHGDWPDFCFTIDENGLPVGMDAPVKMTATQVKEGNIKNNLRLVLAGKRLTHSELIEAYISREMCSERTAIRHIKTALQKCWVNVQTDNRYNLTKTEDEDN